MALAPGAHATRTLLVGVPNTCNVYNVQSVHWLYHWLPIQGFREDDGHLLQAAIQQHEAQAGLKRPVTSGNLLRKD